MLVAWAHGRTRTCGLFSKWGLGLSASAHHTYGPGQCILYICLLERRGWKFNSWYHWYFDFDQSSNKMVPQCFILTGAVTKWFQCLTKQALVCKWIIFVLCQAGNLARCKACKLKLAGVLLLLVLQQNIFWQTLSCNRGAPLFHTWNLEWKLHSQVSSGWISFSWNVRRQKVYKSRCSAWSAYPYLPLSDQHTLTHMHPANQTKNPLLLENMFLLVITS